MSHEHYSPDLGGDFGSSPVALGLLLRRAHDRFADAVTAAIRPHGLELRHFWVLIVLAQAGPLSQVSLSDLTRHEKAGMVRIVDELERIGLVTREPSPDDRRVRLVTLTPHGRSRFREAQAAAEPAADTVLAPLEPGLRDQLKSMLTQITPAAR